MAEKKEPKLRSVQKYKPPYPLNKFPEGFALKLGKEIIYLLATKGSSVLEGPEWEQIFATCINARWKPSNVGLDDISLGNCAWSAKSVKSNNPETANNIRLISGRNSPAYSFGESKVIDTDANILGEHVLAIWNERVSSLRAIYNHLRTVVLVKSSSLETVAVYEFETILFEASRYNWKWNERKNLEGYDQQSKHCFTWQPHGSQFTIIDTVPDDALIIKIKRPKKLDKELILKELGFKKEWISAKIKNGRQIL